MDPITHGLLGATFAGALRLKGISQHGAMLVGALAGVSPDLDVLIRSAEYPLLSLKFHRHFTHAIPFSPLWGLFVVGVFWWVLKWRKREVAFAPLYILSVIAIIAHGALDAMTNYGTHLYWPLSYERVSWNIISIIDPIFTLTLLAAALMASLWQCRRTLYMAIAFACCYWGLGIHQREASAVVMQVIAKARGHKMLHAETKPSFGNLWAWRMQYIADNRIHIDAAHISPWAGVRVYEGGSVPYVSSHNKMFANLSPLQTQDLQDFEFFSDSYLTPLPEDKNRIADARFGTLPNSLEPMWAIELYPNEPNRHAGFVNTRRPVIDRDWKNFWKMAKGEAL
jgi:inner membrane protein